MRTIKFRAWQEKQPHRSCGVMSYSSDYNSLSEFFNDTAGEELMQFTGLHDKNGKEIYEGDYLKIPGGYIGDYWEKETVGLIEWSVEDYDPTAGFYLPAPDGVKWSDCEVIGNVFENSDLIPATP